MLVGRLGYGSVDSSFVDLFVVLFVLGKLNSSIAPGLAQSPTPRPEPDQSSAKPAPTTTPPADRRPSATGRLRRRRKSRTRRWPGDVLLNPVWSWHRVRNDADRATGLVAMGSCRFSVSRQDEGGWEEAWTWREGL